jgi:hypothetical protein
MYDNIIIKNNKLYQGSEIFVSPKSETKPNSIPPEKSITNNIYNNIKKNLVD